MSDVERIKDAVRIEDYISMRCPQLKRAGNYYKMCCPRHADKSPSFIVNPESQTWKDYGACGKGGDVIAFVMWYDSVDFGEALHVLADYAHITLEPLTPQNKDRSDKRERLYACLEAWAAAYQDTLYSPFGAMALKYLRETRGLTDDTIRSARMGYAAIDAYIEGFTDQENIDAGMRLRRDDGRIVDRFRNRIMIPIRDHKGRVVGFSGRAMDAGQQPKFLYNTGFEKSKVVHSVPSKTGTLRGEFQRNYTVVVEGSLDPISALNRGIEGISSLLGKEMSEEQFNLLVKSGIERLIFCLDKDAAGQAAAVRGILKYAHAAADKGVALYVMTAPHGKDPDDTFREHPDLWQPAVDAARPAIDVLIEMSIGALPQSASSIDKQKVAQSLIPLLKGSNALLQEDSLKALAKALDYPLDVMKSWTDKQALIVVMPKTAAPKSVTHGPTDEHWLLFYILRFEADEYLNKAHQVLCRAGVGLMPVEAWHQVCFGGLSPDDFTHPECQRLMCMIRQARERNEPLVDALELDTFETDMQEAFERCMNADEWARLSGQYPDISLSVFLDTVLCVRMSRVDRISMSYRDLDVTAWMNYQSAWVLLDELRSGL